MANPIRELLAGISALLRGFGMVVRRPRLFALGALPAVITSVLFLVGVVALLVNLADLTAWLTPFAADWDGLWSGMLRAALGVALVAGTVLVMVIAFTTVTLALGAPLYDQIAESVEEELGNAPAESEEGIIGSIQRGMRQAVTLVTISLLVTVVLFAAGFVPVLGQTVVPVVAALFGGWMLGIELLATAFERRGLRGLRDRHARMRRRGLRVLGFAVPTYLLLAIPFVAVAVFPAAAAGGTILARDLLPETSEAGAGS